MAKYKSKPYIVEAIQFKPPFEGNYFLDFPLRYSLDKKETFLLISTPEGDMKCNIGDWIITGLIGEQYPCKDEVFQRKYELV